MNVTVSEIVRKHAIAPDLTTEDVAVALKRALVTKLGYARVCEAEARGDLRIEVVG